MVFKVSAWESWSKTSVVFLKSLRSPCHVHSLLPGACTCTDDDEVAAWCSSSRHPCQQDVCCFRYVIVRQEEEWEKAHTCATEGAEARRQRSESSWHGLRHDGRKGVSKPLLFFCGTSVGVQKWASHNACISVVKATLETEQSLMYSKTIERETVQWRYLSMGTCNVQPLCFAGTAY